MPGRICAICANTKTMKRGADLIAAGLSDQKIADQLNLAGNAGRMLVSRHRRYHVEAVARVIAEAASKGRANVQEREQLVAAAEAGDLAAAFIGLNEIAADLQRVRDRLERVAGAAEVDNQRLVVSSLSAQQLRAAEVRARLGGVGAYGGPRATAADGMPMFNLTIRFSDHVEQIVAVDHRLAEPTVFDVEADPTDL